MALYNEKRHKYNYSASVSTPATIDTPKGRDLTPEDLDLERKKKRHNLVKTVLNMALCLLLVCVVLPDVFYMIFPSFNDVYVWFINLLIIGKKLVAVIVVLSLYAVAKFFLGRILLF